MVYLLYMHCCPPELFDLGSPTADGRGCIRELDWDNVCAMWPKRLSRPRRLFDELQKMALGHILSGGSEPRALLHAVGRITKVGRSVRAEQKNHHLKREQSEVFPLTSAPTAAAVGVLLYNR